MIEGVEEVKLGEGETKIAMDQYYMDEYDQYAEGTVFGFFSHVLVTKDVFFFILTFLLIIVLVTFLYEKYVVFDNV